MVINDPHRSTLPDGFRVADYTAEGSGHSRTCTTTLGQRLRDLRESRNLTQYQVAALLGYQVLGRNAGRVSQWERGKHLPDLRTLSRYATAFDTTVSEILRGVL